MPFQSWRLASKQTLALPRTDVDFLFFCRNSSSAFCRPSLPSLWSRTKLLTTWSPTQRHNLASSSPCDPQEVRVRFLSEVSGHAHTAGKRVRLEWILVHSLCRQRARMGVSDTNLLPLLSCLSQHIKQGPVESLHKPICLRMVFNLRMPIVWYTSFMRSDRKAAPRSESNSDGTP